MFSDPAIAVLATRIRIALLRLTHQSVDATNMVADTGYAQEVIALCRATHESGLSDLADQFENLVRKAGRILPGANPPGPPASRFEASRAVPPGGQPSGAAPGAPATGPGGSTPPDEPEPPPSPSDRRYMRGAR
jgi:hypothetical protein